VIVIIGSPAWRPSPPAGPTGRACGIALAAAARGSRVELVGRVGEDPVGEALLIALANAGVGHVAVLRDPSRPTLAIEPPAASSAGEDGVSPLAEPAPLPSARAADASAAARLEGADVELAIRYLEPSGVMVVTDDVAADALAAAVAACGYAQMRLVVLLAPHGLAARTVPAGLPEDATVLAAPDDDAGDGGAFAALVGAYAAALDSGAVPAAAFAAAQGSTGWEPAAAG
jgi:hypothetical protein